MIRFRYKIKTRFFLTLILILIFLSSWIYMVWQHKELVCAGVNISSQWGWEIYSPQSLLKELEANKIASINNEKLKNIDLNAIRNYLESKPWIWHVRLFFTPKHILEVIVNYRIPVAKVYFKMQGSYKYLDKEGKLLPRINGTFANIPLLVSSLSEMDNFFQGQSFKNMVELLQLCEVNEVWRSLVDYFEIQNSGQISARLRQNGTLILFGDLYNLRDKICKFAIFYSCFWSVKHRVVRVIDLRFRHQVLIR